MVAFSDITERKRAEEALSGMARKLVEAQEQERARIARELHDDINQRLALLAVELEQLTAGAHRPHPSINGRGQCVFSAELYLRHSRRLLESFPQLVNFVLIEVSLDDFPTERLDC